MRPTALKHRRHAPYAAFALHRLSGLVLALYLPVHFLVLGLALEESAALDDFLAWTDQPLVKLAEALLVVVLVAHLVGGLRILTIELVTWKVRGTPWVVAVVAIALAAGLLFALSAGAPA
jgi:fumarate reductase subunit D